ncbi:hypothetical protein A2972_01715 [Candidatus Amesbacteria bacterium RIFCSPLOWO2_01_FULL_47_33]|uniref:Uncharacterized protein n=3 Tax=Candidatus Amesiibacteriota TaxID=1752730 RepID=A0A1F4Z2P1_9BACT|nr:MAG: hypothetical protein A2972_01715 [Candidatus Amesbacteria bacterium RIFCSPLOWO2_01_FULL_47_33]
MEPLDLKNLHPLSFLFTLICYYLAMLEKFLGWKRNEPVDRSQIERMERELTAAFLQKKMTCQEYIEAWEREIPGIDLRRLASHITSRR